MPLAIWIPGKRVLFLIVALVVLAIGLFSWNYFGSNTPTETLSTTKVAKGNLVATVMATGTIEPEEVVDVGAQIVGIINEFGRDPNDNSKPVDFGTKVDSGTILALIDNSLYRARLEKSAALVEQSKAHIAQAEADLGRAVANAKEAEARANQTSRDYSRAKMLHATGAITEQDFDVAKYGYEVAKAEITVTEAAIRQAQAALNAAKKTQLATEADQREAQKNLDYTTIRSPVKGVIIDRRVNVGQTVVSNLNAPSLFLIAKDLQRLQVWASVNEADIGRIQKGQPVRFSVDAFPGEEFKGEVSQVRLNATMTQNVVTYTVVVTTDNSNGKLLPYLTATLKFEVGRREEALLVPNAALRWQPQGSPHPSNQPGLDHGTVWVLENGSPRKVEVRTGLSDGLFTELIGEDALEGEMVIVGDKPKAESGTTVNPFAPNIMGGKKKN